MARFRWVGIAAAVFLIALTAGTGARLLLGPKTPPGGPKAAAEGGAVADSTAAGAADATAAKAAATAANGGEHAGESEGTLPAVPPASEPGGAIAAPTVPEGNVQAEGALGATEVNPSESTAVGETGMPSTLVSPGVDSGSEAMPPVSPTGATGYKQFAKILNAMKPAEAAKLLEGFSDDQVEEILRTVGARKAADLLGRLPEDRAARLGRRLLQGTAEEAQ